MTPTFNLQRRLLGLGGTAVSFESSLDPNILRGISWDRGVEVTVPVTERLGLSNDAHRNAAEHLTDRALDYLRLHLGSIGNGVESQWSDPIDALAAAMLDLRVWSGWALNPESLWTPHSWILVHDGIEPEPLGLLETTDTTFSQYFGVHLYPPFSSRFQRYFSPFTNLAAMLQVAATNRPESV